MICWGLETKDSLMPYYQDQPDFGILCAQNRSYEDRFIVIHTPQLRLYAVFDGHGESDKKVFTLNPLHVVLYIRDHLPKHIISKLGPRPDLLTDQEITDRITTLFLDIDRHMFENGGKYGCTCCMVLIIGEKLVLINLGDSRAIIYTPQGIQRSTIDHKPDDEHSRIQNAGGWVRYNRVCGTLAMSRAFGDYSFKVDTNMYITDGCVIARPDITIIPKIPNMKFIIATDGIYDGFQSNQHLLEMIDRTKSHGEIVMDVHEYGRWDNGSDDVCLIHGNI